MQLSSYIHTYIHTCIHIQMQLSSSLSRTLSKPNSSGINRRCAFVVANVKDRSAQTLGARMQLLKNVFREVCVCVYVFVCMYVCVHRWRTEARRPLERGCSCWRMFLERYVCMCGMCVCVYVRMYVCISDLWMGVHYKLHTYIHAYMHTYIHRCCS